MRDGQLLGEIGDCIDVDLDWSPSTNTLPIQRLEQSYERLPDGRSAIAPVASRPTSPSTPTASSCNTA